MWDNKSTQAIPEVVRAAEFKGFLCLWGGGQDCD